MVNIEVFTKRICLSEFSRLESIFKRTYELEVPRKIARMKFGLSINSIHCSKGVCNENRFIDSRNSSPYFMGNQN